MPRAVRGINLNYSKEEHKGRWDTDRGECRTITSTHLTVAVQRIMMAPSILFSREGVRHVPQRR
jgi:hypothetical protein